MQSSYVYILANKPHGVLYTGVTSNLPQRIWQHKQHLVEGFTKRYGVTQLVWYELHQEIEQAILREKRIKAWKRDLKLQLIETFNPEWMDLYDSIL